MLLNFKPENEKSAFFSRSSSTNTKSCEKKNIFPKNLTPPTPRSLKLEGVRLKPLCEKKADKRLKKTNSAPPTCTRGRTNSVWKNFTTEQKFPYDTINENTASSEEASLCQRISNCRDLIRQGTLETKEVRVRKKRISVDLDKAYNTKAVSKDFYKEAQMELKKFNQDLQLGNEEVLKNVDNAYKYAIERNNRSLEFYTFINENNICYTEKSIDNIHEILTKIEELYHDTNLQGNIKQKQIFGFRGHLLMDSEQSILLENLKEAIYKGNSKKIKNVEDALLIIKKYLTHDLPEELDPDKDDVFNAYADLQNALTTSKHMTKE